MFDVRAFKVQDFKASSTFNRIIENFCFLSFLPEATAQQDGVEKNISLLSLNLSPSPTISLWWGIPHSLIHSCYRQQNLPLRISSCKLSTCIYLFLLSFPARYYNLGMMWEPTGVILNIDSLLCWHFVAKRKLHGCRGSLLCQISVRSRVIGSSPSFTFCRERESKGQMLLGLGLFKEPLSTCKSSLRNELWSWLCGRRVWSNQKAPHNKAVNVSGQTVDRFLEVLALHRGPGD